LSGQHAATHEVKQSMNRPGSMRFMRECQIFCVRGFRDG
jgi:hypothetical protein